MEPILREPVTLYRGIAMLRYPDVPFLRDVDDVAEFIFNEPYPPLCSQVALRYNADEAYRRYRELRGLGADKDLQASVEDHYQGDREYSFFVSASRTEAEAAYFAGNSLRENPFGLIVRFTRDHDYEIFKPAPRAVSYTEALLASRVEPREIDKILVVGCKAPNQMVIDFLFKKHSNGRVRKYRNAAHMQYTFLRNVKWSRDGFFHPPLEEFRET